MYGCSVSCTNLECQSSTLTFVDRIEERSLKRAYIHTVIHSAIVVSDIR